MNCQTRFLLRLFQASLISLSITSAHALPMYQEGEPEVQSEPIMLECGADVDITGKSVLASSTKPGKEDATFIFVDGLTRGDADELQKQLDTFWTGIYGRYAVTNKVFGEADGDSQIAWSHARKRAEKKFRNKIGALTGLTPKDKQQILKESSLCLDHFEESSGIAERYICPDECPPSFFYRAMIDSREMKLDGSVPADIIGRQVFCGDRAFLKCDPLAVEID